MAVRALASEVEIFVERIVIVVCREAINVFRLAIVVSCGVTGVSSPVGGLNFIVWGGRVVSFGLWGEGRGITLLATEASRRSRDRKTSSTLRSVSESCFP